MSCKKSYDIGGVVLADTRVDRKNHREGMSHPTDCSKNSVMKPRNESSCKLEKRKGKSDAEQRILDRMALGSRYRNAQ
jgi:hypothetical protein